MSSVSVNAIQIMQGALRDVLAPLCADASSYALVDFPAHPNVGDSAIYKGELILLDELFGKPAEYVCEVYDFTNNIDTYIARDGIIFLHGGGNFGDTWPAHQRLREEVLRRYPDHRVVQLPQSIHFSDPAAIAQCAKAIAGHPDFTLLVRDQPSFDLAQTHFDCPVHLCPDAAYMMGPQAPSAAVTAEVLCMFRQDHEKRADQNEALFADIAETTDWLKEAPVKTPLEKLQGRIGRAHPALRRTLMGRQEGMFRRHADVRVARGFAQLSSAEYIVTDRLHVHIFCALLGKPHVIIDNSYGKIQRFVAAWPDDGVTHIATGYDDARARLDALRTATAAQ